MIGLPGDTRKRKPHMVPVGGGPQTAQAPTGVPTSADPKSVIVAWLLAHGVSFSEAALMTLTKDELLSLVADLLD